MNVIGTCSNCGGSVSVPSVWMGIIPPTPICDGCGAVPVAAHGPVIPMQRRMRHNQYQGPQQAVPSPWSTELAPMWRNGAEAMIAQGGRNG